MTVMYSVPVEKIAVNGSYLHIEYPECFLCGRQMYLNVVAPFGSDYCGAWFCNECWHEHFDPAIKKAKAKDEEE